MWSQGLIWQSELLGHFQRKLSRPLKVGETILNLRTVVLIEDNPLTARVFVELYLHFLSIALDIPLR